MRILICFLLISIFLKPVFSQNLIYKISSINPDSSEFSDLSILKVKLNTAQIVALGEQSHGDGATFDAKVRLIKYLHEYLGFNIIAFESGLYDCTKANDFIENGGNAESYLFKAIFGVWDCVEVKKLAAYINETRKTSNPLILSGIDCQFAGKISSEYFPDDFIEFIDNIEKTTKTDICDTSKLRDVLGRFIKYSNFFNKLSVEDTTLLSVTTSTLLNIIEIQKLTDNNTLYWKQILCSLQTDYRRKFNNPSIRDSMMASNALWLLNNKNEKIILWGATAHFAFNTIHTSNEYLSKRITTGTYLKNNLQNRYYCLAFTSYKGKAKSGFLNLKVNKPANSGIENFFFQKGFTFAFCDMKELKENKLTFSNSKIFGHYPYNMDLSMVIDGLFYIYDMYPAKYY